MVRFLSLFLAGLLVGSCQPPPKPENSTVIDVGIDARDTCRVSVSKQTFVYPGADERRLLAVLRDEAKIHSDAAIIGGISVPYRCLAGAIEIAQRAGFERVGYIAEPPPENPSN